MLEIDDDMYRAFQNGADGYLIKNIKGEEFLAALYDVMNGRTPISPAMAYRIVASYIQNSPKQRRERRFDNKLKERELEVLRIVGTGAINKEIAASLNISIHTVNFHIRNMFEKLNVRNKAGLAGYAMKMGISKAP